MSDSAQTEECQKVLKRLTSDYINASENFLNDVNDENGLAVTFAMLRLRNYVLLGVVTMEAK